MLSSYLAAWLTGEVGSGTATLGPADTPFCGDGTYTISWGPGLLVLLLLTAGHRGRRSSCSAGAT